MAHALQDRFTPLVLAKLRKTCIFKDLFNKKYDGDPTSGAVKIPVRDGEVVVTGYDKVTGAELTTSDTAYKTLPIDKDIVINELIDRYEAAAVPDNLIADRLDSAGYSKAKKLDGELIELLVAKGTVLEDTTKLTKTNIYDKLVDWISDAEDLGLNTDEMWLAVTSKTHATLRKSPEFIRATSLGDNVVQNGYVGEIAGVKVFKTNNIKKDLNVEFILGNEVFAHFVDEWAVPVAINDLHDGKHVGASALQGRDVYGADITRPETIFIKKYA